MSVPLTEDEQRWLKQFEGNLIGDYNNLTLIIPPRIRMALKLRLEIDARTRQWEQDTIDRALGIPL